MWVGGVDEAGRGAVVGPLVIATLILPVTDLAQLESLNPRDSKQLSPARREEIDKEIRELANTRNWAIKCLHLTPLEIDTWVRAKGLNRAEADGFGRLLSLASSSITESIEVLVDACDVNAERFGQQVSQAAGRENIVVSSKHGADARDPVVGAASILAKVERDASIRAISKECNLDLGSGYPSDPRTRACLPQLLAGSSPHPDVRWSWSTVSNAWKEIHHTSPPVRSSELRTRNQTSLFDHISPEGMK